MNDVGIENKYFDRIVYLAKFRNSMIHLNFFSFLRKICIFCRILQQNPKFDPKYCKNSNFQNFFIFNFIDEIFKLQIRFSMTKIFFSYNKVFILENVITLFYKQNFY